jgi:hypothetical protein
MVWPFQKITTSADMIDRCGNDVGIAIKTGKMGFKKGAFLIPLLADRFK